ncbi:MAG TPA: glycosyltransferase family 4 protein [Clostridia bacterium]|nr:glycosyltransferase family 4 protein [Clostridia bacterium]
MRIMLINHYAGSEYHGMEFRPYYLAREWVKQGHEVVIVAADYSHLRKNNPESAGLTEQSMDGIRYLWVKTPPYHGNGAARAKNMAAFVFRLLHEAGSLAHKYQPEAVIASSTYPFDIYPAQKIARLSSARLYFEIHDLWPLTQIELYGLSRANPYVMLLQKAEDYAFTHAEKVISVLPQAYLHMEERGVSRAKFAYVPNGVSLEPGGEDGPIPYQDLIGELKSQGKFIVLYLGGFAKANALDEFVKSASLVGENVELLLVGDGVKNQELMDLSKGLGDKNIRFLDPVPKNKVRGLLNLADCLYIGARRCSLYRYGVGMNKLYDYMMASRPVISGVEASNDPVAESRCGLTVRPEDEREIAGAVRKLSSMPRRELEMMGANGRAYVESRHDYRVLAKKFEDLLKGRS